MAKEPQEPSLDAPTSEEFTEQIVQKIETIGSKNEVMEIVRDAGSQLGEIIEREIKTVTSFDNVSGVVKKGMQLQDKIHQAAFKAIERILK